MGNGVNGMEKPKKNKKNVRPKSTNSYEPTRPLPDMTNSRRFVTALYNYEARQADDLAFQQSDRIEIINDSTGDWYYARNTRTNEKGYVPSNYLTNNTNSWITQEWWFTGDRRDADKELMTKGNVIGTFLLRNCNDKKSFVALSVRDFNSTTSEVTTRHYKIQKNEMSEVYIIPTKKFAGLEQLIAHYSDKSDGLCTRLTKPCPKRPVVIPFREFELKRSEIEYTEELGQGQFGKVYKGKWNKKVEVAVKTMKTNSMSKDDFINEARTMHRLWHPRLVQLMGVCTHSEPILIVTEFMLNGSLVDYLRKDDGRTLTFSNFNDMATNVSEGMAYLEKEDFVHRDVRAANILVAANLTCKVADFGLARATSDDGIYGSSQNTKFPLKWTAPEAIRERTFSTKSDVWSFGILLYEIFTLGKMPYPGKESYEAIAQVEKGYRMPRPTQNGHDRSIDCPPPVYDIMLKCWNKLPEKRPSFEYLFSFFSNYLYETEHQYRD